MKLAASIVRHGWNALKQKNERRTYQSRAESSTHAVVSPTPIRPDPATDTSGFATRKESARKTASDQFDDPVPSPESAEPDIDPNETDNDGPSPKTERNIRDLLGALRTLYPTPPSSADQNATSRLSSMRSHHDVVPPERRDSGTYPDDPCCSFPLDRSSRLLSRFVTEYIDVKDFLRNRSSFAKCESDCSETVRYAVEVLRSMVDGENEEALEGELTESETCLVPEMDIEMERKIVELLRLLRIFSRMDAVSNTISQQSGITILTKLIRRHPFTAGIQTECSAVLANLASHAENRTAILEQGCIGLLLKTMQRFRDSVSVQVEVCAALANLGCRGQIGKSILSQDGCILIAESMFRHLSSAEMQIQGFHALSSIAKSRCLKGNSGRHGVTEEVKKHVTLAMKKHQWNPDVMTAACSAIACLCFVATGLGAEKEKIMGYLLLGLSRFRLNPTYINAACFALAHFPLTKDSDADLLRSYNGTGNILEAMKAFPYHESLQTTALFALGSIVMSRDDARVEVLEKGGITVMLQSMGRKYDDVQDKSNDGYAAPALCVSVISEGDDGLLESSERVPHAGYEDGKLQSFSKRILHQMFAAVALLNLGENAKCKEEVLRLGGIHYIFDAAAMVHDQMNLRYVTYYVFGKYAGLDMRSVYMKSTEVPSLGELCRCALLDQIAKDETRLKEELKCDTTATDEVAGEVNEDVSFRNRVIDALSLPNCLGEQLREGKRCFGCGKACFESSVKQYDLKGSRIRCLCSLECGKLDACQVIAYRFPPKT